MSAECFESAPKCAPFPPAVPSAPSSSHSGSTANNNSAPRAVGAAGGLVQGAGGAPNMETDTTQLDVTELNRAANTLRHVAIRRFEAGFNVTALNTLADCVLRAMHVIASEPTKGTNVEDEDTPPASAELAVLKNPSKPETLNRFMVGKLEDTVIISALGPRRLSHDEALNLAAWLIAIADEPVAFDHVNAHGAVISVEFVQLLREIQNT